MASKKEIRNAILDVLKERIDKNNYGLLSRYNANVNSKKLLNSEHIKIAGDSVLKDGKEIFRINRKYSTRKRDGLYKELVPTLESVVPIERNTEKRHSKYILGVDLDGTAGEFRIVPLDRLYEERYFAELAPHQNLCDAVNAIARDKESEIDVVVVSAYLTDSDYALKEKNEWCDTHLSAIDEAHRIFIPNGENKADYIARYIEENYAVMPRGNFTMLDDYTPNLNDVDKAGYHAVKFMNEINGTHGTWQGDSIRFDREDLEEQLRAVVKNETALRDVRYEATHESSEIEPNIVIQNFVKDYHSGEVFAQFVAFADYGEAKEREVAGTLDYSVVGDTPSVTMIEVAEEYRRRGIGTNLMQMLQQDYPNSEINFGHTTSLGTPFIEAITYTVPDEVSSPLLQKYEQLQQRLTDIENGLKEIYALDEIAESRELTLDEQKIVAGYEQLGDAWDSVYTEISQIKGDVEGLKATHTFVYIDEEEKTRNLERYSNKQGDKDIMATVEEKLQQSLLGHEETVRNMKNLGYEPYWVDGFSDDGFVSFRETSNEEHSFGFDGWDDADGFIEDVYRLADNFSLEDLTARANGNYDVIEYGMTEDNVVLTAVANYDQLITARDISLFYEHSDEAQAPSWIEVYNELAENSEARESYRQDIADYLNSFEGEISQMEKELGDAIIENLKEGRSEGKMASLVNNELADDLSRRLSNFMNEFDPYEYNDNYENEEMAIDSIRDDLARGEVNLYLDNLYEIREDMGDDLADAYGEEMAEELDRLITDLERLEMDFEREQRDVEVAPEDRAFSLLEESDLTAEQLRAELEARIYNRTDSENPLPTRASLNEYSDEVLRRAIEVRAEQEELSHREENYYQLFYSYEREQAVAYARENNYHMIWGSDDQGLNGDGYVVYRNAQDLPLYLREYAQRQEEWMLDMPYSYQEQMQAIYMDEMVRGVPFDAEERLTRVEVSNENAIVFKVPTSESVVRRKFKELYNNDNHNIDTIHSRYNEGVANYISIQNRENIKNRVGQLESDATYPMIASNSPWGAGIAHLYHPENPQNYIELSLMGYEVNNSITVEAKLIENGNQVVASAMTSELSFADISRLENLSYGFTQYLDPSFREEVAEMAKNISLNHSIDLNYISDSADFSKHFDEIRQRGFEVDELDYSRMYTEIDGHNCWRMDSWEDGTATYTLGRDNDTTDGQWYYVAVNEKDETYGVNGNYTYEFDRLPTRQEIEDRHINNTSQIALNNRDEGYGMDGSYPSGIEPLYYEAEFGLDGTADELYTQARNGYIENPDALKRVAEILTAEGKTDKAERVGYMEEREREGDVLYSVAQMKLDMLDGHGGIDDLQIAEGTTLSVNYENNFLLVSANRTETEENENVYSQASAVVRFDEFKNMSQQDFENVVNELIYYGMEEVERVPIQEKVLEEEQTQNNRFPQFEYVTVDEAGTTGWNTGNDSRNYGYVDGLVRGFNIEFKHKETGEINYNSANFVEGNIEDYYRERIEEWGDVGYTPFEVETRNGYEPTGRAVFRGYGVERYDEEERDTYIEDVDIDKYLEERGMVLKPAEEIDTHKSIMENITNAELLEERANQPFLIPIDEIRTPADGKYLSGENAGRSAVYEAVRNFERNNPTFVPQPVIDENGSYEDKDFLYSAYDRYVAMSNEEQLKPYEEKLAYPSEELLAQIHYGLENGLSEDDVNLMIESANVSPYGSPRVNEIRLMLEEGWGTDSVKDLIAKDSFMLNALRTVTDNQLSDKQKEILRGAEEQGGVYTAKWLMDDARNTGDSARYDTQAEALVEVSNAMLKHNQDLTSNTDRENYGSVPLISSVDRDLTVEQLKELVTDVKINATADELRKIGNKVLEQHKGMSWDDAVKLVNEIRDREKEQMQTDISHRENSNGVGIGTMPNHEAEDKRRAFLAEIKDGVRGMMTSEKFKAYLDTRSHLFYRNFSVNNTISIFMRKPNASYVMGYDQWQAVGRTPLPKTGIPIIVPMFYYEKYTGGLYKSIRADLTAQLERNPDRTAVYRIGKSGLELTMIKNTHSMGVRMNGKEVGILDTEKKQREFIDSNILNKMVAGFTVNYVFDVSDTVVKDKIWVRQSEAKKSEMVLDKNGEPIKGTGAYKGKVQIYNTPERQAKFQPNLDMSVVEKDPAKMKILHEALVSISERHGVPVTVVDRESDENLRNGADGYFRRPSDEIKSEYPRGYIVMPRDVLENEPTRAVANLIHEIAHSDLHGNLEKLSQQMGDEKITRDMKEIQAEATAYLTAKQYGLDTSTASFSYLANWAQGFDLQTFEKSLDVINIEATKLVSEISAELESRGLTHDLQDKPKEPLSAEQTKAMAGAYVQRALEAKSVIDNQLASIPTLVKENEGNTDLLDIVYQQKKNLDLQIGEVEAQLLNAEKLETSVDRAEQEELISVLDASFKRSDNLRLNFAEKNETFAKVQQRDKVGLKEQFVANPQKTLNAMKKEYPQLAQLSDVQRGYIAKSQYIRENLVSLLNSNPQKFIEEATKRAVDVEKVMAKNGSFVEVAFCESWKNGKVFEGGEIMHPKVADKIVKEAESQISGLKAQAESKGEYVPYIKCGLTVFTVSEKAKNLSAYACRIDLGDGQQKGLADYLHQVANSKTELVQHFDSATREKNAKDKIIGMTQTENISHGEEQAITTEKAEGESLESWKEDINNERNSSSATHETHNHEKNRMSKNDRAD